MSSTNVVPKEDCWLFECEGDGDGVTDDENPLKSSYIGSEESSVVLSYDFLENLGITGTTG